MKQQAALHIDKGIGKVDVSAEDVALTKNKQETKQQFEPYKGQRRKAETGCITQLNTQLWEGRYSPRLPDGKQISRNIYAKTEEECKEKLKGLIAEMKAESLAMKNQSKPAPL